MKAVILAGGLGTRMSEETEGIPKPMIEVGNRPILWHILKIYSSYDVNEFIICCGYRGYIIKEYFANYFLHMSDVTIDMTNNTMDVHFKRTEPWKITLVDTGDSTMTGGRLRRVKSYVENEKEFCLTYGDGLANIDISNLVNHHQQAKTLATITAVTPPGRFGAIDIDDQGLVKKFTEKPGGDGGQINGGFFVLSPEVIDLIKGDSTIWEDTPMETLAKKGEMTVYRHNGFWHPMDTMRDKKLLEELWASGKAPWKIWK